MGSALCGPGKGVEKAMRCPCCGMESDNPNDFAVSLCWPCSGVGGLNPGCERCLATGVWVDRFSSKRGKGHRAAHRNGDVVVTRCGQRIPWSDCGAATAVRDECRRCWPETYHAAMYAMYGVPQINNENEAGS